MLVTMQAFNEGLRRIRKFAAVFLFLLIFAVAIGSFLLPNKGKTSGGSTVWPPAAPRDPIPKEMSQANVAPVRITFVGDIMLDRYIREVGTRRGYERILENVSSSLKKNDIVVGNLEGPVTAHHSLSISTNAGDKNNLTFTFPPEALNALFQNNILVVSIGNNHILDFGSEGLVETRHFLKESRIEYFGDPDDEKRNALVVKLKNRKVGFVSFNQFLPYDQKLVTQQIKDTAAKTDMTVVYAHWGEEYADNPNEKQIALGRSFVDAGADLVVGTHPHVIQKKETYQGKTIYYSLGNFVFDQYFNDSVRCGAIISVTLNETSDQYRIDEAFAHLEKDGSTAITHCVVSVPTLQPTL